MLSFGTFLPFPHPSHCFILPPLHYFSLLDFLFPTFHPSWAILSSPLPLSLVSLSDLIRSSFPPFPLPPRFLPDSCLISIPLKLPFHIFVSFLNHPWPYFYLLSYNFSLLSSALSCFPLALLTLYCPLVSLPLFLPSFACCSLFLCLSLILLPPQLRSLLLPSSDPFFFLSAASRLTFSTFSPHSRQANSLTSLRLALQFSFLQN